MRLLRKKGNTNAPAPAHSNSSPVLPSCSTPDSGSPPASTGYSDSLGGEVERIEGRLLCLDGGREESEHSDDNGGKELHFAWRDEGKKERAEVVKSTKVDSYPKPRGWGHIVVSLKGCLRASRGKTDECGKAQVLSLGDHYVVFSLDLAVVVFLGQVRRRDAWVTGPVYTPWWNR